MADHKQPHSLANTSHLKDHSTCAQVTVPLAALLGAARSGAPCV